jgi:hypothetical protein
MTLDLKALWFFFFFRKKKKKKGWPGRRTMAWLWSVFYFIFCHYYYFKFVYEEAGIQIKTYLKHYGFSNSL